MRSLRDGGRGVEGRGWRETLLMEMMLGGHETAAWTEMAMMIE